MAGKLFSRTTTGKKATRKLQSVHPKKHPHPSRTSKCGGAIEKIEHAVEEERARLMVAESILHCAVLVLNESDRTEMQLPNFESVVDVARRMVLESINQLDSVNLHRANARTRDLQKDNF